MEPTAWMQREFTFDQSPGTFPTLLERLRGTAPRAVELFSAFDERVLSTRLNGSWSPKEHVAHLADLGRLDNRRLQEFLSRASILSAADKTNRATETASHNNSPSSKIVEQLRISRVELIHKLEALVPEEVVRRAIHPRLQKSLRLIDWVYFVAEHDDHHLAKARCAALRAQRVNCESGSRASVCLNESS